jgi:hypothetical protein
MPRPSGQLVILCFAGIIATALIVGAVTRAPVEVQATLAAALSPLAVALAALVARNPRSD